MADCGELAAGAAVEGTAGATVGAGVVDGARVVVRGTVVAIVDVAAIVDVVAIVDDGVVVDASNEVEGVVADVDLLDGRDRDIPTATAHRTRTGSITSAANRTADRRVDGL